ncbi:MAG: class 1 fructose-bisphosphatase [Myxococcales bacterium]|nr:class 1 fructose-bisphosphatase [Myxococcales bacterium]MCB9525086.1 class 1 fructose-bisphosphatase [Myxococcales bacterium]
MSTTADFGITLTQHVMRKQVLHPSARGQFSTLLTQIGVAAKHISAQVRRAGLIEVLGATGETNIQGERVQKLDHIANDTFMKVLRRSGTVAAMASEEEDDVYYVEPHRRGDYIVAFDPLDGSSNIDVGVSIGTIFAIYPRKHDGEVTLDEILRPGHEQVGAGYVIYGSSTVFVYADLEGVSSFTLDPGVGEFFLTRDGLTYPKTTSILSLNECNEPYWGPWVTPFLNQIKGRNDEKGRRITDRHIGSLVSDFHRNLIKGGIYLYPVDHRTGRGKLRLLYECNPLAFIAEKAGGAAIDGQQRILDKPLTQLHQRTGLVIGPQDDVDLARRTYARYMD